MRNTLLLLGLFISVILLSFVINKIGLKDVLKTNSAFISFSGESYEKLLLWEKEINLSDKEYQKFVGLDASLPCCGFGYTQQNYEDNCRCGHHLALYGLAKQMIKDGKSRDEIQSEINKWKVYFFPEEYRLSRGVC